ncbi:substrate-binding periplasmic protein [Pseudodesulfovibrio portus]|nr:transporter substrate-binding domain-containing protein [Pseudodesulfovibrio portus]
MPIFIKNNACLRPVLPGARTLGTLILLIALIPILFVSTASGQETDKIRVAGFLYPPFYQTQSGVPEGIAVDLANAIFSRLNRECSVAIFPLKRTLSMLKNGEADCTLILIKTPERQKFLHFTEPIITVRGLIWSAAHRGAIQFQALDDLRQYKIGVTRGYSYGPEFDDFLQTMQIETANSDYSNMLKLLENRIDIFPGNELVVDSLIKRHPELQDKLLHSSKAFIEWELRIAVSRKSWVSSLLPEIEAVLADLKREGVVSDIVKTYLP